MSYNYLFRFILVGDSAVGKSSMLLRYEQSSFQLQYQATIGIQYASKLIDIDQLIKLEIWDTSGQEVFRSIARSYYRNCCGVVLVYDVSNKKSFQNITRWLDEVEQHANNQVSIMLVGTKIDIEQQVSTQQGKAFAAKKNFLFAECSAKTGQGIAQVFEDLARYVLTKVQNGQIKINFHGVDEAVNINHNLANIKNSKKKKFLCC